MVIEIPVDAPVDGCSLADPCPVHSITHPESPEDSPPVNFLMRLELFMGIVNRNIAVFHILNECLTALYHVTDNMTNHNVVLANFAFFNKELSRFCSLSETNKDVAAILKKRALCSRRKQTRRR